MERIKLIMRRTKGAGVLCYAKDTGKFLLAQRAYNISSGGKWCAPGGKFDPHEKEPSIVAEREFKEESGYKGKIKLRYLYTFKEPTLTFFSYVGIIENQFEPSPDKKFAVETEEFRWLSLSEMINLDNKHVGLEDMLSKHTEHIKRIIQNEIS